MINSTDTDNSALIVAEINLLQTEKLVVLEINLGLSPVFPVLNVGQHDYLKRSIILMKNGFQVSCAMQYADNLHTI